VGTDLLHQTSPDAALPSTVSGRSEDFQSIVVPQNTDSHGILNDTNDWPPETDRLTTLATERGFLAGPGVIPVQVEMSAPQVVDQEQDKESPQLEQVALFEDKQSDAMDQLPPESGDYRSQTNANYND
jgi:hypothetical protein